MSEQVFEGKTVEDALARAAAEMDVRIDELAHEVVEEAAEDFWGLDEPTTKIRAWPKGEGGDVAPETEAQEPPETDTAPARPERDEGLVSEPAGEAEEEDVEERPAAATGEPAGGGFWGGEGDAGTQESPAPPAKPTEAVAEADHEEAPGPGPTPSAAAPEVEEPAGEAGREATEERESVTAEDAPEDEFEGLPEEIEDPVPEIRELLARVFEDMSFECEAEIAEDAEQIDVMISGADKDYLVENSGKGISALELILNHAFRHRLPRGRKIRVDAGDFRSRREEELRDLAFQVAHSAKQSGNTQETQELNPYERRLVHLALADDEEVTTRSRGQGFLKHVQVIPQGRG